MQEEAIELQEASKTRSDIRMKTPEREPATKRPIEEDDIDMGEESKVRKLEDNMLDAIFSPYVDPGETSASQRSRTSQKCSNEVALSQESDPNASK